MRVEFAVGAFYLGTPMKTRDRTNLVALVLAIAIFAAAFASTTPAIAASGGGAAPGSASSAVKPGGDSAVSYSRRRGPKPVVTALDCYRIGQTRCQKKNHRAVQIGGELVVRGHHFSTSLRVYFPRAGAGAARVDPVSAPLRPTPHGFAVTIPPGVTSGRIYLAGSSAPRSNLYGPVKILAAPVVRGATPAPAIASPFDGTGMWIWYLDASDGGNLAEIAAQAKAAGITTLFVKSSDGPDNFWAQFTPTVVQTLHSLGLNVCAWQYVYGADPAGEAAMGAEAVADGADCLVIDAESQYEGNYWAAQTYIQDLRAAIGANYPVGLTSFAYTNVHPSEPYSVFLGPGGAQYDLPQVYWQDIGTTPDDALADTFIENRIYGRPIVPVGQSYDNVPASAITRFRQLAEAYGDVGFSFYSWQATNSAGWTALEAPFTPGTGITLPTAWPDLGLGAHGDQVIWMQEHLAAAERGTPTAGDFNSLTESNLIAFQNAQGLSPSGVTDAETWTALLALTPVPVRYPKPPPSGSTGPSGASGSSGSSGSSGASGSSGSSGASGATGGGTSP